MILTSVNVCVGAIFRTTQYRIPTRLSTKRKNVERVSVVVEQKRRELNPFQMSYCWQIHTLASKALVPIPQSHGSICVGLSQSQRVPCSPWWRHPHNTTSINNYPSVRCDDEGISKIRVPDRNTSLFPRRHHPLYTR